MTSYLATIESTPSNQRWPLVRGWMQSEPLELYSELRRHRPVLELPELVLVSRFRDCVDILSRHDRFSVSLYKPKQGDFWMSQDDTPQHWREKSIMRALLDREVVSDIRSWVREETVRRLGDADGAADGVASVTRGVPIALVQHWFGYANADPAELRRWSYWNQMDAFWNQPFDTPEFATPAEITANREQANASMRDYLIRLVQGRAASLQAGNDADDMVSRMLKLAGSQALRFDTPALVLNLGGLLIGAIETTSHAVVNALDVLMADAERLASARAAALSNELGAIDGFVTEALRFKPAFPYFFRTAEGRQTLSRDTDHAVTVDPGRTVLAVTHSAMFDDTAYDNAGTFDPGRQVEDTFTFGHGLHECLGRAIGQVMIAAIVREVLRLEDFQPGAIDRRNGPVPESWSWRWRTCS